MSGVSRLHGVVFATFCVIVPAASWLDGSGRLAFSMFADMHQFRVELRAREDGGERPLSPTRLANAAGGTAGLFLIGGESWRYGPKVRTARWLLGDLAAFACREDGRAHAITITLFERDDEASPARSFTASHECSR
jgi:hypothetical protein